MAIQQRLRSRAPAAAPEPPRSSLRITAFGSKEKRADTSRQIFQENEFGATSVAALRLTPLSVPYDPLNLATIVERSNMLKQCIEAKVTNVGKNGFEVAPVSDKEPSDPDEEEELQSFIDFANSEESLTTVHAGIVDDYETYGYAFMEIIRDKSRRISIVRRVPSQTCRVLPKDKQKIKVMYDVLRGKRTAYVTEYRTFRGYVQIVDGKSVFFKEFGDPRKMNSETGRYEDVTLDNEATEIIHFRQKSLDAYGVPRWITQLPSILGSRESEEVNLRYFEDNTVPPMILSVSGGRLTALSFRELERAITKQSIGKDRQHKILLLEAVPEREGLDEKGATVQLKVDKLTDARQSDGLFSEYDKSNQDKIRSSFRLPPTVVGMSQDTTYATAQVSAFIAETQVFGPDRQDFDEAYNKKLIQSELGLGLRTVKLVSKAPPITNQESIIKSLTALNVMGALTPRMAISAANKIMQHKLPQYPEKGQEGWEEWMDRPIIFVTRGTASQDGQRQKDGKIKDTEEEGVEFIDNPEHGQE